VYRALAAFGAPPRRIDILNRATGITFADAVAEGGHFEVDGRPIPIISRNALLKNSAPLAANRT
jgi:hypothetical protein